MTDATQSRMLLAVFCFVYWAYVAAQPTDAISIHRHTAHTTIGLRAFVSHRPKTESSRSTLFGLAESLKEMSTGGLVLPVYVVSLPSATARRAKITQQLRDVNAHFTLVEAIDAYRLIAGEQMHGAWHVDEHPLLPLHTQAALLDSSAASPPISSSSSSSEDAALMEKIMRKEPTIYNLTIPHKCRTTKPAHLACSFAHILTILSAYKAGQDMVMVLEDDMQILRWPTQATLDAAPPDWQVLQLYMLGKKAEALYTDPPSLWVPWSPGLFNTGAYIINRAGMQKVIETYIPQVLSQIPEVNVTLITKWDASTIDKSECVADYVMYNPTVSYSTTDFYFVEEALDSSIKPEQLGLHQSTKQLVLKLMQEQGFQQDLR